MVSATTSTPKFNPALVFRNRFIFAETFLYILDKGAEEDGSATAERSLVRLRYNTVQKKYLSERKRRNLIVKSRQQGISTAEQADMFYEAVTRTVSTATLAHEDETTQKLRRMVNRFWDNMPKDFRPARKYSNSRLITYPDFDSEAILATAGNKYTGRGGTYTRIHFSEAAFSPEMESIMAGILQGGNPELDLESTPNGAQGYFYEKCMEVLDGNPTWTLFFFQWWLTPEYRLALESGEQLVYTDEEAALVAQHGLSPEQIKWRRDKRRELKHLFFQEYPEDIYSCFLLSGTGYFGDVSHACQIKAGSIAYDPSHTYVAGLDFGQSNDYTVLSVLDKTTLQQVAILRINRLGWPEMRRQVIALCKQWNVSLLVGEANSMGRTNLEAFQSEMPVAGCDTQVRPFETTNLSKAGIMSDLHEAIHGGGLLLLDDKVQRDELQKAVSKQTPSGAWKVEAPSGGHDDTVIALALSLRAVNQSGFYISLLDD